VKPQNILVDGEGRALLTDFGSARVNDLATLTQTGAIVGTLGYTAPNVLAGGRADARDDVYALGMTLYFALTAELPPVDRVVSTSDRAESLGAHPRDVNDSVPAWLDAAVAVATARHPADRFPTAARFAESLSGGGEAELDATAGFGRATRCVVCGDPEPMGGLVCAFCESASASSNDTLVVVRGEERAAARVPSSVGEAAVSRLLWEGKDAVAVPARLAWTAIPLRTWLLALLVCVAGFAATTVGFTGYWQPVVVAAILLASAERTLKAARKRPRGRGNVPPHVHDWMVGMFAELPRGTARELHAGLTTSVRSFYDLTARHRTLGMASETVGALYLASCVVARDLADTERLLDQCERAAEHGRDTDRSPETQAALERTREAYVQRLLEATDSVRRLGQLALREDAASLTALVADLSRQEAALREVEEAVS
jgi:hypothetical protein